MKDKITLEANGEFPFTFWIEKAIPSEEEGELIIEGIASTTNVDHDSERMSKEALGDMAKVINEKSVPLRVEHNKDSSAIIGQVFKAWVDDRNQLHVRASLDKSHPVAPILHSSMKQGAKMGLSVGGVVKRAMKEYVESVGKMVKTFYDVVLNEVSVTPRPANYDSWLMAKHIVDREDEAEKMMNTGFHDQFLFENPTLDYLQVFAKSIPDKAWQKVDMPSDINKNNNNNNFMKDEIKKKEETTDETTKAVSHGEFEALKTIIAKGFESVGALFGKLAPDAPKEQANPEKDKADEATQQKAKAQGDDAMDQNNPDKKKPESVQDTAKAMETDENYAGGKTKAETSTETDEKKKATKESTDEYKLETVDRAIKSITDLTAKIKKATADTEDEKKTKAEKEDEETKTKAEDDKEDEETEAKEKSVHPLDQFVMVVTKALEAMNEKMEKSGKTILGFQKSMVDTIKNDPVMQEEIAKMMKVPGRKQSVAMGVPYMVTKEGKRYALTATEVGSEEVQKSRDAMKGKSFKDIYKTEYSSVKAEE